MYASFSEVLKSLALNYVHLDAHRRTHTSPCAAVCLHHTKNNIFLGSLWHHKTLFAQFYVYLVCLGQLLTFSALLRWNIFTTSVQLSCLFANCTAEGLVLSSPDPITLRPPPHHHHANLKPDTSMFSPGLFYFPFGDISIYIKNNIALWRTGTLLPRFSVWMSQDPQEVPFHTFYSHIVMSNLKPQFFIKEFQVTEQGQRTGRPVFKIKRRRTTRPVL